MIGQKKKLPAIARLPSEAFAICTPGMRDRWQVFGLAGSSNPWDRTFY